MQLTLNSDFSDEWCEPPEAEFQPLLDFENEILNQAPHNDISLLTQRIKRSFLDYVRQGIMLETVRRYRLYKRQYADFAEYCKLALGRSPSYCHRIIQAAQVCIHLIKSKFKILPTSVAQASPLVKFAQVDEYGQTQLEEKWQTVLDGLPPHSITAAKIAEALDENPEDRAKQVRIGGQSYRLLLQKAAAAGMAVSKYLEMLIGGGIEPPDDEEPDDEEPTELTPEQGEICDRAEAYAKAKPAGGFAIKTPSECHQKAINLPGRSGKVSDSS
ncbi:hypothetical protein QUB05_05665 [Microcoleus sp. F10-C6]|uniref:hypothetical protein n=1 Tax=unclassified Microcoleus TaxID=2642155 RepID=UPI002FD55B53